MVGSERGGTMSDPELPEGVAAVIHTAEQLNHILENVSTWRTRGAVLLEPQTLRSMEHIGLAATAIFNPYGPTVETLSIAVFDGNWDDGRPVLLRRKLHPFSGPYIQVVVEVSPFSREGYLHLNAILQLFLAGNGASRESMEWADRLHLNVPSGILITSEGETYQDGIRRGLGWVFQHAGNELAEEVEKIDACGSSFWDQATWETDRWRRSLMADRDNPAGAAGLSGTALSGIPLPDAPAPEELETFTETAAFTAWWQRVVDRDYQQALFRQLPEAWYGAIRQVPALEESGNEDFRAWWELFQVASIEME
jgi:hypothetical protein